MCNYIFMEGKRFNSVFKKLRYGLIRTDAELKMIDFNAAARELLQLPKRGSSLKELLRCHGTELEELGQKEGSVITVSFPVQNKSVNAAAFREESGGILFFVHPLLSVLGVGRVKNRYVQVAQYYSSNILWILKESEQNRGFSCFRMASVPNKAYFSELFPSRHYTIANAMRILIDKLKNIDFNKEFTIVVDKLSDCWAEMVSMTTTQYVLSELFTVLELYGAGSKPIMHFGFSEKYLKIVVRDELCRKPEKSDTYFARVFTELMKLIDVGCEVRIDPSGSFSIKVYIPTIMLNMYLSVPDIMVVSELWAYFDYCMDYYSFGKEDKPPEE